MKIDYHKMLTANEKEAVCEYSAQIGWGFTPTSIRELLKRYIDGDIKEKAKVCYLLEDCNFHNICALLADEKVEEAKKQIDKDIPLPQKREGTDVVVAWVMETSNGKYLHMNTTEDGNGTFFDETESLFDAYWTKKLNALKEIRWGEFSAFEEGFPKYHKIRFSYEYLDTAQDD